MTEDNRILGFGHVNPCLYCDVLATEAALQFAAERVASVGFYGYGMCRLRTVSDTGYFKVVFAQITGGNRFVECNLDITPERTSEKFSTSVLLMLHTVTAQRS